MAAPQVTLTVRAGPKRLSFPNLGAALDNLGDLAPLLDNPDIPHDVRRYATELASLMGRAAFFYAGIYDDNTARPSRVYCTPPDIRRATPSFLAALDGTGLVRADEFQAAVDSMPAMVNNDSAARHALAIHRMKYAAADYLAADNRRQRYPLDPEATNLANLLEASLSELTHDDLNLTLNNCRRATDVVDIMQDTCDAVYAELQALDYDVIGYEENDHDDGTVFTINGVPIPRDGTAVTVQAVTTPLAPVASN